MIKKILILSIILSLFAGVLPAHASPHYIPRQGDYFQYSDVINLNNATGAWYGYSEHETVNGIERMNTIYSNGTIASNYTETWRWSNSSGSTMQGNPTGNFSWSSSTFQYTKGNDNQTGVKPLYVWFYMDNTTQQGGTWRLLNTPMTVTSANYSYPLTFHGNVWTIRSTGTGGYQRNYGGLFNAAYSYTTYSDPSTGYIVGYDYVEQDTGTTATGSASFTWSESLYVTSTSYPLANAPATPSNNSGLSQYLGLILAVAVIVLFVLIIMITVYAVRRNRSRLPKHPPQPQYYQPPAPAGPPPQINLEPRQPPVQQIVVKEVVKVKCQYCGALIDSTVKACPFCGAPRT